MYFISNCFLYLIAYENYVNLQVDPHLLRHMNNNKNADIKFSVNNTFLE